MSSHRKPKLSKAELAIMDVLWRRGVCSVREIQEALPEKDRPAFTTVQTMVYRLEGKGALRCVKRIANANIFEAALSRDEVQNRLVDELLGLFGVRPVMARLVETGQLTLDDIKDAERALKATKKRRSR